MSHILWKEPLIEVCEKGFMISIDGEEIGVRPQLWNVLDKIAAITKGDENNICYAESLLCFFKDRDYLVRPPNERLVIEISKARRFFRERIGNPLIQGSVTHGYYVSLDSWRSTDSGAYYPINLSDSEWAYCFRDSFEKIKEVFLSKITQRISSSRVSHNEKSHLLALRRLCLGEYSTENLYKILNRIKTRSIEESKWEI